MYSYKYYILYFKLSKFSLLIQEHTMMAIAMITVMVSFFPGKLFSSGLAPQKVFLFKFGGLNFCELDQSTDQITVM